MAGQKQTVILTLWAPTFCVFLHVFRYGRVLLVLDLKIKWVEYQYKGLRSNAFLTMHCMRTCRHSGPPNGSSVKESQGLWPGLTWWLFLTGFWWRGGWLGAFRPLSVPHPLEHIVWELDRNVRIRKSEHKKTLTSPLVFIQDICLSWKQQIKVLKVKKSIIKPGFLKSP